MRARWSLASVALLFAAAAMAQQRGPRFDCDDEGWGWRSRAATACEVRELVVPANGTLMVDAGPNGSIHVTGERRRDVQVRAVVRAWAEDDDEAERIANAVVVRTDGTLRAEGPTSRDRAGFSVSYELVTPLEIDLALEAHNGGISVTDVSGNLRLQTRNGSISLDGAAGTVSGRTTNGGVDARLVGDTWEGEGLDLRTTNGGVRLRVPEGYSARLEAGTVNGGIDIDFPVTMQGRIGREVETTLGRGGPRVRATTTNGQVRVSRLDASLTRLPN